MITWLSIHTECRACGSCWESCENVYFRMFARTVFLRWPFFGRRCADTFVMAQISSPSIACISVRRVLCSSRTHAARSLQSLMKAVMRMPPPIPCTSSTFSSLDINLGSRMPVQAVKAPLASPA